MAVNGLASYRAISSHPLLKRPCVFCCQRRHLHARVPIPPVPQPTPFVPDAQTFLTLIGRNLSQHASKFPSWEALFTFTSPQLRALGIEPPRNRRYLLHWREKFRKGEFGVGGSLKEVKDGVAVLRILEVPVAQGEKGPVDGPRPTLTRSPGTRKVIANLEDDANLTNEEMKKLKNPEGFRLLRGSSITGSNVEAVKGFNGSKVLVKVKEGMWEDKRGQKVDGGERRKAMVRANKRAAERKAQA